MPTRTILLTLVVLVALGASAYAEELAKPTSTEALQHYEAGKAQFKAGQFQAAIDEFQTSLKLEPSPAAHFNAGQCYRTIAKVVDRTTSDRREHLERAVWHYERFIRTTTNTPEYTALATKHVAEVRTALDALPPPDPAVGPSSATNVTPATAAAAEPPQPRPPAAWWNDPLGWGLAGAGVVGLGAAGLLFHNASSLRDDASRTPDQKEASGLRDTADSRSLSGTIIGIGSGLLLGTGIVKLVMTDSPAADTPQRGDRSRHRSSSRPALGVWVSPTGASLFGHF